ncbi:phytanoyl-CoA dioxygenase family protein [Microlunatus speluncae]|uniref:phytanoyl-CoA dioxygenase family protein n=1 Tax=Microlunatus speluncae TaxID=2594267 RepID=UPI0012668161|nr:phytanoyl-CoA dioxygenase family protein [Microlunatus speluncae]
MSATTTREHRLDDDQVDFYDRNGYLILRNRIPAGLLDDLRRATEQWMDQGRLHAGPTGQEADFKFASRDGDEVMFRVDYVHGKGSAVSLQLLGSPHILGIAESLAGPNFVPTYESLVFKAEGDGAPIAWHQDAVHPRNHRIFNIDIYLDDSLAGQGALRVVPGSQRGPADICALTEESDWDLPGAIEVELRPGDVLVHDTMIVHGSPATRGNALRRTIYYEFRPAEQILAEGPWDAAWVDTRLRLLPLGLAAYADRPDAGDLYQWRVDEALRPVPVGDAEAELRVVHTAHTPGAFCSAGSV